jgi:phosphocarrier protein HPr
MPIAFKEPSMTEPQPRDSSQIVIADPLGLHMRTAAKLVILARPFRSDIRIIARGATADAKSLLDLVTLAAGCGTPLDIVAHGPDAEAAVASQVTFFGAGLDGSVIRAVAAA